MTPRAGVGGVTLDAGLEIGHEAHERRPSMTAPRLTTLVQGGG
jgi:hypothetical protein